MCSSDLDGVTIRGNTVEGACDWPTWDNGTAAIYLSGSRNVTIEGNTVLPEKQGKECKDVLKFGPGVDASTVKVQDNEGLRMTGDGK